MQGIQLPASCTAPATREKVMLSQPTALCSVCNTHSHVTPCHSVISGQNPNSKQPEGGRFELKQRGGMSFQTLSSGLDAGRAPVSPRGCVIRDQALGKCPTNLSFLVERFSAAFIVHCVERRRLRGKGEPEYLGLSRNGRKQKQVKKLLYF